jgi:hypothetical protein
MKLGVDEIHNENLQFIFILVGENGPRLYTTNACSSLPRKLEPYVTYDEQHRASSSEVSEGCEFHWKHQGRAGFVLGAIRNDPPWKYINTCKATNYGGQHLYQHSLNA